jgi:putative component of toxin-antitoxin plasmid stabilization module
MREIVILLAGGYQRTQAADIKTVLRRAAIFREV